MNCLLADIDCLGPAFSLATAGYMWLHQTAAVIFSLCPESGDHSTGGWGQMTKFHTL